MQDIVPHSKTNTAPVRPARDSTVQSIVRAMQLLDFLRDYRELSVTELARVAGMHKSTAHRLLATLEGCGYVRQDPSTERYSLGVKVIGLANALLSQLDVRTYALPFMRQLMLDTHETVHLGMLINDEVMCVESVISPRPNAIASMAGKVTYAHVSSMGKIILAHESEGMVTNFIQRRGLPRLTQRTITDPAAFRNNLAKSRELRVALNDEEEEVGIRCVASVILDHTNTPVAAISVAAPTPRLDGAALASISTLLRKQAAEISRGMGARG